MNNPGSPADIMPMPENPDYSYVHGLTVSIRVKMG